MPRLPLSDVPNRSHFDVYQLMEQIRMNSVLPYGFQQPVNARQPSHTIPLS